MLMLALTVLLGAVGEGAWAKSCEDAKNDGSAFGKWTPSAKTTVKNRMSSTTVLTEIYRGNEQKKSEYLKPGEDISFTGSLGGNPRRAPSAFSFTRKAARYPRSASTLSN